MLHEIRSPPMPASDWLGTARADMLDHLILSAAASHSGVGGGGHDDEQDLLRQVSDHLLAELHRALSWNELALFVDCVGWAKAALIQRGVPPSVLEAHLERVAAEVSHGLPEDASRQASRVVMAGLRAMPDLPAAQPAFLQPGALVSPLAPLYFRALLRGDRRLASRLVLAAVEGGVPIRDIYLHVFQPAQYEIGRLWQLNQIGIAEEHYCTAATQLIMSQLYKYVFSSERIGRTVVVVCVGGDLHELGARMVADFFEMDGWDSYYTGANTAFSGVIEAVASRRADVLAISATIPHHVQEVKRLIDLVRTHPDCAGVKIIVGGLPFTRNSDLWRTVGADGTGANADSAIAAANTLVGRCRERQ
jgi:methanogenic corrinoid protein MtbC1